MLHLNFPAASLVDFWKEPEAEESAEEQRLTQEVPWVESTTWMMVGMCRASFRHMETHLLQVEHMQQTNLFHDTKNLSQFHTILYTENMYTLSKTIPKRYFQEFLGSMDPLMLLQDLDTQQQVARLEAPPWNAGWSNPIQWCQSLTCGVVFVIKTTVSSVQSRNWQFSSFCLFAVKHKFPEKTTERNNSNILNWRFCWFPSLVVIHWVSYVYQPF